MNMILKQAQKLVMPTEKLQKQKNLIAEQVIKEIQNQVTYSQVSGVEIAGSFAKGTWLPQKADIDIFIKFQTSVSEKEFVELGKKIGFAVLKDYKPYVRYAQHPFVEAEIKGTKVNIVPCYDVREGDWKSAADRSPFHTRFMMNSLTPHMKNEVRLLKAFLKANDIYGAEIAKQGFSGYVSEVLVLNFGSFENVIREISTLKKGWVIGKAVKEFDTPITIMDPIDGKRNLGAAISAENVAKFVLVSRAFLRKPSISFFKPSKKPKYRPKEIQKNILVLSFKYKQRSPDIIWGQLKRTATSIATQIEREGFSVLRKATTISENNDAALLFLLEKTKLDQNHVRIGPDFYTAEHVERFIATNKKKSITMWINEEGKICSIQKRSQIDAVLFLQDLIRKNLQNSGVPAGLMNDIRRFRVTLGHKITSKSIKEAISELVSTDETVFSN